MSRLKLLCIGILMAFILLLGIAYLHQVEEANMREWKIKAISAIDLISDKVKIRIAHKKNYKQFKIV